MLSPRHLGVALLAAATLCAAGCEQGREAPETTVVAVTAETCAAALVPARAFIAAHPPGSTLDAADSVEIRTLFAEAYNYCPPDELQRIREDELFPWVRTLVAGDDIDAPEIPASSAAG